jgi:hypothetical protein
MVNMKLKSVTVSRHPASKLTAQEKDFAASCGENQPLFQVETKKRAL